MTVYLIYVSFIMFVILLLIIGCYFMSALRMRRLQSSKVNKKVDEIKDTIIEHMEYENVESIPGNEIEMLKRKVSTRNGLHAFFICYKDYVDKNGYDNKIKDYAGRLLNYKDLLNNRIVRDKYRKSYILYLLGEFRINSKEVEEFAVDSLDNNSIYVRNNALRVIRYTENIPLMLRTIETIENQEHYYNYRVLVDFIDNFMGDKDLLNESLLNNIDKFGVKFQRLIIEHFSNSLNDKEEVRLMILDYLSNSKEKEIIIVATRYFGRVLDERAKSYILNNLDHKDWEIRAISARIIANYNNENSRLKLLQGLKDKNYYVRFNSAFSYIDMEEVDKVFNEVNNNIDDPFAKEIAIYAMHAKNIIDYQQYKDMTKNLEAEVSI